MPCHEFATCLRVKSQLYGRLRKEGLIADRVPALMFRFVDMPPLLQHKLSKTLVVVVIFRLEI